MTCKEIQALLIKSEKYLHSAALLIQSKDFDSSVSRSYYAMFYAAEALLLSRGLVFSSHRGVISGFGEQLIKPGILEKDYGRMLNRAFSKRQLGDYEHGFVITEPEAIEILEDGKRFLQAISSALDKEQ